MALPLFLRLKYSIQIAEALKIYLILGNFRRITDQLLLMKRNDQRVAKSCSRMATLLLALTISIPLWAQIPEGYYSTAEGKSKAELKSALHKKIKVGKRLSYGSGDSKTWSGFEKTDRHPDGYVWDMYSTNKRYFPGNGGSVSGMNIEHSVAKSWWGGSSNDAYKDLYHLNPSDAAANSARSNYPLGVNNGGEYNLGSIKVGLNTYKSEYNDLCFEPLDEYKGDFARAYLYMFTCYEDYSWTGTKAPSMINENETYPMLKSWAKDLLVEWSRKDPVSSKEINRAEAIYKIQENRNPFIDYPELVEYLWGNKVGQAFTTNQTDPVITSPAQGATIQLPGTHYTTPSKAEVQVLAKRLTGELTLALSGSGTSKFTLSASKITKEEAIAGKAVTITFTPTKAETATAQLTISGGGVANPIVVTIGATAIDNFSALPASNIGTAGFRANWTPSSTATDYELNVYQIIRESSGGFKSIVETNFDAMPQGWSSKGYTLVSSGEVKMASGNQNGILVSPALDLSTAATLTIKAKQYGSDNGAKIYIVVDGQTLSTITTEVAYKVYTVEMPAATKASVVEIQTDKGKRVYITDMAITTGSETIREQSVAGFPMRTGLTNAFDVKGLVPGSLYYYTVRNIGVQTSLSAVIEVQTKSATSIEETKLGQVTLTIRGKMLYLYNLPQSSTIRVIDVKGRQLAVRNNTVGNDSISINATGMVIVKLSYGKATRTEKMVVK